MPVVQPRDAPRRPRKLRSCLDRVAIDPHRSRASIRLLFVLLLLHLVLTLSSSMPLVALAPLDEVEARVSRRKKMEKSKQGRLFRGSGSATERIRRRRRLPCKTGRSIFIDFCKSSDGDTSPVHSQQRGSTSLLLMDSRGWFFPEKEITVLALLFAFCWFLFGGWLFFFFTGHCFEK